MMTKPQGVSGMPPVRARRPMAVEASRLVETVEATFVARPLVVVSAETLAQAVGVSTRTLHRSFARVRGHGPMEAIRRVRLAGARRELTASPVTARVTDVACRWGFFHFGRFAARYRTLFGELPSETLTRARRQGTPPPAAQGPDGTRSLPPTAR